MGNTAEWVFGWKRKSNLSAADPWVDAGVAMAAGDGLLLRSDALPGGIPEGFEDFNIGQGAPTASYRTTHSISGQLGEAFARYEGVEKVLAQVAGDDIVTDINNPTESTTWEHVMDAQLSNIEHGVTIAWDPGLGQSAELDVHELPSVRVSGFELKLADRAMVIVPNIIANKMLRGAPAITTKAGIAAMTYTTEALAIIFNSMRLRLRVNDTTALASADEFFVNDVGVVWDRNQEAEEVNRSDGTRDEPESSGSASSGTLRLVFPNYIAALDVIHTANVGVGSSEAPAYKAELFWDGPLIVAASPATNYSLKFEFPKLVLNPSFAKNAPGPQSKVPVTAEFGIFQTSTPPVDGQFDNLISIPWRATVVNENAQREDSTGA